METWSPFFSLILTYLGSGKTAAEEHNQVLGKKILRCLCVEVPPSRVQQVYPGDHHLFKDRCKGTRALILSLTKLWMFPSITLWITVCNSHRDNTPKKNSWSARSSWWGHLDLNSPTRLPMTLSSWKTCFPTWRRPLIFWFPLWI